MGESMGESMGEGMPLEAVQPHGLGGFSGAP